LRRADLADYRKLLSGTTPDVPAATRQRNNIINRITVDVESSYKRYETTLFSQRATLDTVGDMVEVGVSAATTVVGGADVKSLLAAGLTGLKGSRLSYSKNFYREKTTEIIIARMEAGRAQIKNQIVQKMTNLGADRYPFEEAWSGLIDFFYAGTLEGGLEGLAADAGSSVTKATDQTQQTVQDRIELKNVTSDQLDQLKRIRTKFNDMFNAHDVTSARQVLSSLGVEEPGDAPSQKVFTDLNAQISKVTQNPAYIEKLLTAFGLK